MTKSYRIPMSSMFLDIYDLDFCGLLVFHWIAPTIKYFRRWMLLACQRVKFSNSLIHINIVRVTKLLKSHLFSSFTGSVKRCATDWVDFTCWSHRRHVYRFRNVDSCFSSFRQRYPLLHLLNLTVFRFQFINREDRARLFAQLDIKSCIFIVNLSKIIPFILCCMRFLGNWHVLRRWICDWGS